MDSTMLGILKLSLNMLLTVLVLPMFVFILKYFIEY